MNLMNPLEENVKIWSSEISFQLLQEICLNLIRTTTKY